jgi:hypothetical protein
MNKEIFKSWGFWAGVIFLGLGLVTSNQALVVAAASQILLRMKTNAIHKV